MILAILAADLSLVVAVSTLTMLISYFIANIAAFRLPRKHQRYPRIVPVIGAITCTGLVFFLNINSWIIGIIGLVAGIVWYAIHQRVIK
jgi:APA family basic amino acid/polyamine antiporter